MNKKKIIVLTIITILVIIIGLWITGIIPKQIAKISASNYLKKNLPERKFEFVDIEWNKYLDGYSIKFKDEKGEEIGFIMNNKYFPISVGQGTFALEENYRVEFKGISDINDMYIHSITDGYVNIRSIPKNYSKEQAQQDNCFVIGAMVHNDYLYNEFMEKYKNKKDAFIRVAQNTVEGDLFLIDLLYEASNDKIHLVKDDTRDRFSAQADRTIKYTTYEKIGEWNYQNRLYWVAYNGELPDGTNVEYTINSDELFIIATIN